jgi:hypothetical protein
MHWLQAWILLKHVEGFDPECAKCGITVAEFQESPTVSCDEYKAKLAAEKQRLLAMDKPRNINPNYPHYGI